MAEAELKDNAVVIVVLLILGVAIVSMLFFMRSEKAEDILQGKVFVVRKPAPQAPAAPPAAPEPQAEPPAPPAAGAVFGSFSSRPAPAVREPEAGPSSAEPPPRTAARPAPTYAPAGPPAGFKEMVQTERKRMRAVWDRHLGKSAALKAYVKEWNETPELAALKARWHKDYDPVAFLKGVAGEPKFFSLMARHARSPELLSIIKEDVAGASPAALQAANKTLASESVVKQLLDRVSATVGFPLGSLVGGGKSADPQEVLKAVMSKHPELDPAGKR